MRKKIIIIAIPILLIILLVTWKSISDYRKEHYYEKLKENMQDDIERVLYIIHPYCEVGSPSFSMTFEAEQNNYYGIDKKKLLDIDGKSYCKVQAVAKCVDTNKLTWDTYLKCKDYEDEMFDGVLKADYNNLKYSIKANLTKIMEVSDVSSSNPFDYIKNEYYNNIVNLDRDAVDVIINMYDKKEVSGVDAYILALAVQDIAKCDLNKKYNLNWSSAEEFYTLWNNNNNCGFYE